ncbi:ATP-grasp ribosomal peptide maturase [Streptomyces sp. JNUCC 64]
MLTNPYDVTADLVLRVLAERRVPVVRLDPGGDPPVNATLTTEYSAAGRRGVLRTASREVDTTAVRAVWTRRPSPYEGPPGLAGQDRRFAAEQSRWGTGGVLASLPGARYVNHPWHNRAAESKPAQLSAAGRCGFLFPDTLITDDPEAAGEFIADRPGGVVYKPLWHTPYRVDGRPHAVWARKVRAAEISDAVAVCPHLFQAAVPKAFDVRVTAVGDRLHAVRVDSPDLDWRRRQDRMRCAPVGVPDAVARPVAAYLRAFRLAYGAFDFAVTAGGDWYFLECNPNGQWAWQPPDVTSAIAGALADHLQKGPDT